MKCRDYVGRLGKYHLSGFETVTTVLMKIQVCDTSLGRGCNYIIGAHLNTLQVLNFFWSSSRRDVCLCIEKGQREATSEDKRLPCYSSSLTDLLSITFCFKTNLLSGRNTQ